MIALLPIGFFAVGAVLAEEAEERTRVETRLALPSADRRRDPAAARRSRPGCCCCSRSPSSTSPGPYLLLAAMPCGINTLLVAHVYGLDSKLAAQAVAWTTAIAVVAVLIAQSIWG